MGAAWTSASADEASLCGRIYAHLLIHYPEGALSEVNEALRLYPNSLPLQRARVEVLAAMGNEEAMLQAWHELEQKHPAQRADRALLEDMAWGIVRHGAQSANPLTVASSLVAAKTSQDVRGVRLLLAGMRHPHQALAGLAVELASGMRDHSLQQEVLKQVSEPACWSLHLAALRACGRMKIYPAQAILESILSSSTACAEEIAAALESSVNLYEKITPDRLNQLVSSPRMGLRLLACQAALLCGGSADIAALQPLLRDPHTEVRAIALQVMGVLGQQGESPVNLREIALQQLQDSDPSVAISATWLLTLNAPREGRLMWSRWLHHAKREIRLEAWAALVATGPYGLPVLQLMGSDEEDPLIRINRALGLIHQRCQESEAGRILAQALATTQKLAWRQRGIFRYVSPNEELQREGVCNYPEAMNQLVRLELLNTLAIVKGPGALEAIRQFLSQQNWGLSGIAAALLLSEGNEEALEIVAALLEDPEPKIRLQAALVMGLLAGDPRALGILQESYETGDRATREKVLEAFGRIGAMESVPFLVDVLHTPYQNLRIAAASALLQCLNH